jgi:multidrug resistance efflux pump
MKLLKLTKKQTSIVAVSLLAVVIVTALTVWGRTEKAQDFMTAKVEKGDIRNTVSATGTLQAVTTVQVGSQVSGTISALYADFNSTVKKDQVVAQLDPSTLQAQLARLEPVSIRRELTWWTLRQEYWRPKLRQKTNGPVSRAPLQTLPHSRPTGRRC